MPLILCYLSSSLYLYMSYLFLLYIYLSFLLVLKKICYDLFSFLSLMLTNCHFSIICLSMCPSFYYLSIYIFPCLSIYLSRLPNPRLTSPSSQVITPSNTALQKEICNFFLRLIIFATIKLHM